MASSPPPALSPRESGSFIAERAQHVSISEEGVERCAQEVFTRLDSGELQMEKMFVKTDVHPQQADRAGVDWVFFADTLNFSFWMPEDGPQYEVTYLGTTYTGYLAFCAAVNRSLAQGVPLTQPSFFREVTSSTLGQLLQGDAGVPIPLLERRLECLHQVGDILVKQFSGSFSSLIDLCGNSAVKLLSLVLETFPCFRDTATFQGREVSLHKRAQILVADLWCLYEGTGRGGFTDIEALTMFADYRVPQTLQFFGVLSYSPELLGLLKEDRELQSGEQKEVEIRGCSIEAVERVTQRVVSLLGAAGKEGLVVNSILVDQYLWGYRRQHAQAMRALPYHKVRSIYY